MKKIFFVLIGVFAMSDIMAQGVKMLDMTLKEGLALARKEKKHVLLDFYTVWCGPCKTMNTTVFPQQQMGDYINPRFVFLKFDAEKGEGLDLAKKFKPKGYPTYVILDADSKEVQRITGMKNPEAFIAELRGLEDKSMSYEALHARFEAGDRDKKFLKQYLTLLASRYDPRHGTVLDILFKSLTEEEKFSPDYWFVFAGSSSPGSVYERYLIDNRDRFITTVGQARVTSLLRNLYLGDYSSIYFGMRSNPTNELLASTDNKIKAVGMENDPVVAIYRAAADMKINGTVDEFLNVFEKNMGMMDNKDNFITGISSSFSSVFTPIQKERLLKIKEKGKTIK